MAKTVCRQTFFHAKTSNLVEISQPGCFTIYGFNIATLARLFSTRALGLGQAMPRLVKSAYGNQQV
jgi:hypothetical protein